MSNYTNLLKTAREQADKRLASKGLTGSSFQSVEENDADRLLISPPQALVSKRKTVNTDSEKEDDFKKLSAPANAKKSMRRGQSAGSFRSK